MKKLRVMHCLGQLNAGGAETLVVNILRHIDRDRFQFDFLLFNNNKGFYDDEVISFGSHLYYLKSMSNVGIKKYIQEMVEFFKREDIDIVHSHMDWQGGFIAYAAHKAGIKKIIVHSHANQDMFKTNVLHRVFISINKYLIKKYATDCVACSKEAGESLFINDFKILINGIDMDRFINIDIEKKYILKKKLEILDNDIILGTVGSLSENKNQTFLIDILYELKKTNKHYRLVIVGNGNKKQELEDKVNQLGLTDSVLFTGVISDIPEIMSLFDIFLFPSQHEGLGIVAIEAQASGLPCVISSHVPRQVDMGLGLVNFVDLYLEKWKKQILEMKCEKIKIDSTYMLDPQYDIKSVCNELCNIYEKVIE